MSRLSSKLADDLRLKIYGEVTKATEKLKNKAFSDLQSAQQELGKGRL